MKNFFEAMHYIFRQQGVSKERAKMVSLATRIAFLDLAQSDLRFVKILDESER